MVTIKRQNVFWNTLGLQLLSPQHIMVSFEPYKEEILKFVKPKKSTTPTYSGQTYPGIHKSRKTTAPPYSGYH